MRKQNIGFLFDKILWYILYMLPLIIYLIYTIQGLAGYHTTELPNDNTSIYWYTISDCVELVADGINTGFIFNTIRSIIGLGGAIPFDHIDGLVAYFAYFVTIHMVHLLIDVLLFIPRWCHKMLRKGEEYAED